MPATKDDPAKRKPDISIAKAELDWEPRVSVRDGLAKTVEYFRKELEETVGRRVGGWVSGCIEKPFVWLLVECCSIPFSSYPPTYPPTHPPTPQTQGEIVPTGPDASKPKPMSQDPERQR